MDAARKIIRSLNTDARILEVNYSDVPSSSISTQDCSTLLKQKRIQCGRRSFTGSQSMFSKQKNME